jgi:hypothetical protein
MAVTYTNRKGRTYHLCEVQTKRGATRYVFAGEPRGEPLDEVPEGYEIHENVNGLVSLRKKRSSPILPEERETVEALIYRHPKTRNYRVDVKGKAIVVYERAGPDPEEIAAMFRDRIGLLAGRADALREVLDEGAHFSPEMRFVLLHEQDRIFATERWHHSGRGSWIDIGPSGPLHLLARRFVPLLGTDRLYDVHF